MIRRGDPYEKYMKIGKKIFASDFFETRRVASTDPLEATYQISASQEAVEAGAPRGTLWDGIG